jgi:hypothetical protein
MTKCQVQIENHMLPRKLSRDDRNPEGIIPNVNKIDMQTAESSLLLTGGSLVTNGRVTQIFRKEKMRSNNSNDGNYLLLRGILSKLMSSNVL